MTAPIATGTRKTPAGQLTPLELRAVTELAQGGSHTQIARRLGTSPSAVTNALHSAGRRLGTTTSAHLVAAAIGRGLIRPDIAVRPAPGTAPGTATAERVARYMAAEDWLEDPDDDTWWASRVPRFRADYLQSARAVIAIVRGEATDSPAPQQTDPRADQTPPTRFPSRPRAISGPDS